MLGLGTFLGFPNSHSGSFVTCYRRRGPKLYPSKLIPVPLGGKRQEPNTDNFVALAAGISIYYIRGKALTA